MYHWADQIICATNRKRHEINNYMRQAAGRGDEPESGDKIICCRNCWDITDTSGDNALVNGTIGILGDFVEGFQEYPIFGFPSVPILTANISTVDGDFEKVILDYVKDLEDKLKNAIVDGVRASGFTDGFSYNYTSIQVGNYVVYNIDVIK